jgi:anti-sigma factor RsiW
MDCRESCELLPLSIDGELDMRTEAALAAHLAACPSCGSRRRGLSVLVAGVRGVATYHRASASLRDRLVAALPPAGVPRQRAPIGWTGRRRWFGSPPWRLLNGVGLIAAVCASLLLVLAWPQKPESDDLRIANELIADHARAQLGGHVVDLASSDQHMVKPWLVSKLDFSPPVRDFSDQGFPLVGGRLDYVDHHPAAVLIYGYRRHTIEVFVWPAKDANSATIRRTVQGYHVVGWATADLAFRALSDADSTELERLAGLIVQ